MKNTKHIIFYILIIALASSCRPKVKTMAEYKAWFNDEKNGFVKEKYVKGLKIRVQYKPVDLMIVNELRAATAISEKELDSIKKEYGNSLYFMMEAGYDEREKEQGNDIIKENNTDYASYTEKVKILSFNLQNNVWLVSGKDTVHSTLYHYERGYELGKKEAYLFAFPNTLKFNNSHVIFVFYDELFNTGINNFQFDTNKKNLPQLPLNV